MKRNAKEDNEIIEKSQKIITKVVKAITKMADSGLFIINSKEDTAVKRENFDTWLRLISRHPEIQPKKIKECCQDFSDYFQDKETNEIMAVIEIVSKVINKQVKDISSESEKAIRIFDNKMIDPQLKTELIVKRMNLIKEKAKIVENFFYALTYCIVCVRNLTFSPIKSEKIIARVLRENYAIRRLRKIRLLEDVSENLPEVNIDLEKMSGVIEEILSLLIQNMPSGAELFVKTSQTEKDITLEFKGNKTNLKTDFEPFHWLGNEIEFNSCMYAYRRIIEAHNGEINFESKPNHYSAFTIRLPIS